jgi:hypothetical protein
MVAMNGSAPWNGDVHGQVERDEEIRLLDEADSAFGMLLRSEDPEPMYPVGSLGPYSNCYREMLAAYDAAYAETNDADRAAAAARSVLLGHVAQDPEHFAGLRTVDWSPRPRRGWSVAELYAAEFPEPNYLVPGLLPSGLAALAARPKIGKSWMALQVAVAVGVGGQVFGEQTKRGRVLYLALEDSIRRMKLRLQKQGAPEAANVCFEFSWQPFLQGGLDQLLRAIDYHRYGLVIVDTLARALGYVDPNKAADMNLHLGTLQRAAVDRNMTILLIDHHRKNGGENSDVIDDLLGATAKAGVLDVAWGLYRKRGEKTATLKLTGRDIEERELAMRFERQTGCWECLGDAAEIIASEQEQAVLDALKKLGAPTIRELAEVTGQDRSNCFRRVQELIMKGKARQVDGYPARFMVAECSIVS